ncbi:MAG: nucleotidyl transferase AbiEii/AbiGii toxin family protein [Gammaproteobacteria bacterium]|nr:nucleotidyl transferase AbiEii/AbiGii toxin family protein [Gammaproteobacteria bacterium]
MAGSTRLEHPLILHKSPDFYLELIQATASDRSIPAVYVEKDYWITQALKRLHESEHRETVVLKGGTALSKAHHIIERFSEDIDFALRNRQEFGDSRRRRLMRTVEETVSQDLEYKKGHPLESKHGSFRKTAHAFPIHSDSTALGQVASTILVEINAFAEPHPARMMPVASLVREHLLAVGQDDLIDEFGLRSFNILVLSVERTLCEKIMGLVRAGYEKDPWLDFRRRIRHIYDIVMILRSSEHRDFVGSEEFPKLLERVKASDRQTMPNASVWLDPPLGEAMIFANTEELWKAIRREFHGNFSDMVYGDKLPSDDEVVEAIALIRNALHPGN